MFSQSAIKGAIHGKIVDNDAPYGIQINNTEEQIKMGPDLKK